MTGPAPDDRWAVLIEGALSDHSYGASIRLGEIGDHHRARSELDALIAGERPDLLSIPGGARIIEWESERFGMIVEHRVRGAELTRISLVRIRR